MNAPARAFVTRSISLLSATAAEEGVRELQAAAAADQREETEGEGGRAAGKS